MDQDTKQPDAKGVPAANTTTQTQSQWAGNPAYDPAATSDMKQLIEAAGRRRALNAPRHWGHCDN